MISIEQFESACGSRLRAGQITDDMRSIVSSLSKSEAQRLSALPAAAWDNEPLIAKIEEVCGPRCKDRHVSAVLSVAVIYGS